MLTRAAAVTALFTLPLSLLADTPNVEPGLWEYTSTTTVEGAPMTIPPNEQTFQQCLTLEDLQHPDFLLEQMDECVIGDMEMGAEGMSYTMTCKEPGSDMSMDMEAEVEFRGDTMTGTMSGQVESATGPVTLRVIQAGRRIGEC